jgi:SanA protein
MLFSRLFLLLEVVFLAMLGCNLWVSHLTQGHSYTQTSKMPARACALVLGTSPKTRKGNANPYFTTRMQAVSTLYQHGKIKTIIVSGEKSEYYDEPHAMKKYLIINAGIPEEAIIEDPEGFNTRRSILRCKNTLMQNDIVIVSQGFHNLRALFYARNIGMNAIAYEAEDVEQKDSFYRNHAREFLARVKAVVTIYLPVFGE